MAVAARIVRPDAKGRIGIAAFIPEGSSGFRIFLDTQHRIILDPLVEKPLYPRSNLKVKDLPEFVKKLPKFTAEESLSFEEDVKKARPFPIVPRNVWDS